MISLTLRILLLSTLLTSTLFAASGATQSNQLNNDKNDKKDHNEATVAQLEAEMASGKLTSEALTKEYIARIQALDQSGPGVNSVIELNPDALDMARNADKLRKKGIVLGPLHGIPVHADQARLWFRSRYPGARQQPADIRSNRSVRPHFGYNLRAAAAAKLASTRWTKSAGDTVNSKPRPRQREQATAPLVINAVLVVLRPFGAGASLDAPARPRIFVMSRGLQPARLMIHECEVSF